jgi:hypothetical protein
MACVTRGVQTGSLEFLKVEGGAELLWSSVWCRGSRGHPRKDVPTLARQVKGDIYSAVFVTISSSLGFPGQCPFLNGHMARLVTKTVKTGTEPRSRYLVILKCEAHPWVVMRPL